jgi:hypothetical protein
LKKKNNTKKKQRRPQGAAKKANKPAAAKNNGNDTAALREQLVALLKGGGAHVQFMDAAEGFPAAKRGTFVQGLPHTAWQLLEHMRIAQWDILEFSRNPKHVSPEFPEGYWPKAPAPLTEDEWNDSLAAFRRDLREMIRLVEHPRTNLYAKLAHGDGQNILREALVLADHNSYHLGQLVYLRRALGSWPAQ